MIIHIKLPDLHLPRKWMVATKEWQRWLVVLPRLGRVENYSRRVLILPGWHETRLSCSMNCRVWRTIKGK